MSERDTFQTVKRDDLLAIERYLDDKTYGLAKSRISVILRGDGFHEVPTECGEWKPAYKIKHKKGDSRGPYYGEALTYAPKGIKVVRRKVYGRSVIRTEYRSYRIDNGETVGEWHYDGK